ncbi:MAG: hypothetical protein DMD57_11470 [Gemmatimonadetes bacterium]|nr:MAG: hypothetical protein DMD57_11470 [Gemmatimonadota bacterium]PYP04030.1 MAG: hypothetical protein DMD27_11225 [Gemmatimonadota bacterium]
MLGFSRRVIRPVGVVNVVEHRPGHATHRLLVPVDQRPEGGSIARKRAYHQGDVVFTTGDHALGGRSGHERYTNGTGRRLTDGPQSAAAE